MGTDSRIAGLLPHELDINILLLDIAAAGTFCTGSSIAVAQTNADIRKPHHVDATIEVIESLLRVFTRKKLSRVVYCRTAHGMPSNIHTAIRGFLESTPDCRYADPSHKRALHALLCTWQHLVIHHWLPLIVYDRICSEQ